MKSHLHHNTKSTTPAHMNVKDNTCKPHQRKLTLNSFVAQASACPVCKQGPHKFFTCEVFMNMSAQDRNEEISRLKLCRNCFSKSHQTAECSASLCRKCHRRHETLLHIDDTDSTTHAAASYQQKDQSEHTDRIISSFPEMQLGSVHESF